MKILFFAQLKEQLNCAEITLADSQAKTINALKQELSQRGENWQTSLAGGNVLVAVNQTMAKPDTEINSTDEIAFFPPVTGG